jgi:hypothetical protein
VTDEVNIRQMKLISGDEIVCLVSSDNDSTYLVETPMELRYVPGTAGKYHLLPWFALSSSKLVSINKSNVISHCAVDAEVKYHYISLALDDGSHNVGLLNEDEERQLDMFDELMLPTKSDLIH